MDINKIQNEFKKHYKKYDINDPAIIKKYYHSLRVMDLSRDLAKENKLDENDIEIVTLIGLLHDYARFEQWTKYKTYNDLDSIDHGDLAVQMLFDNNEIVNYSTNEKIYDEIYNAIKYHNKLSIPNNLSEHNKLLCNIIRDADKLDIFYLLSINKNLLKEDTDDISEKIEKDFFKGTILDRKDVNNKSDSIILHLAMVYDLKFDYSYKYLLEQNLIWRIYDNLLDKKKFQKYFDYLDNYINERVNK